MRGRGGIMKGMWMWEARGRFWRHGAHPGQPFGCEGEGGQI
jgi:hypothetical protein